MFEKMVSGFESARRHFRGRVTISEDNVLPAVEMVKKSLLEADVEYGVVNDFLERVQKKILGKKLSLQGRKSKLNQSKKDHKPLSLADYFVSTCYEELLVLLGGEKPYAFGFTAQLGTVMMVGLQGVGKTTSVGKLALYWKNKKPLLVACDVKRPAAVEQLQLIGQNVGVPVFHQKDTSALEICKLAREHAIAQRHGLMIVDTAGRLTLDEDLMSEIREMKQQLQPHHTFLVVDAMMGQDAVQTAKSFNEAVSVDGFVLTKVDGDARGGAALSITSVTQKPIVFLGDGEKPRALELFRAAGMSSRILGLGDVSGLAEDFKEVEAEVERAMESGGAEKMPYWIFQKQFAMMKRMDSLRTLVSKLPMQMADMLRNVDQIHVARTLAIFQSMTMAEKACDVPMSPSRLQRVARGSGLDVNLVRGILRNLDRVRTMALSHSEDQIRQRQRISEMFGVGMAEADKFLQVSEDRKGQVSAERENWESKKKEERRKKHQKNRKLAKKNRMKCKK